MSPGQSLRIALDAYQKCISVPMIEDEFDFSAAFYLSRLDPQILNNHHSAYSQKLTAYHNYGNENLLSGLEPEQIRQARNVHLIHAPINLRDRVCFDLLVGDKICENHAISPPIQQRW